MKHEEQFKVAFVGSITRQYVDEKTGTIVKYYRNAFCIDRKYYHVRDANDLSGKAGVVAFIKKGETAPNGEKVANDCFTLLMSCSAGTAAAANAAAAELA